MTGQEEWDKVSLADASAWVWDQLDEGVECPCCHQWAQRYDRALPRSTARAMGALYRRPDHGDEFAYLPNMLNRLAKTHGMGGYATLGHYWGLMEQQYGPRPDGSKRNGMWRLTDKGREFVEGKIVVPKYATIYAGKCLKLFGPPWSFHDALGSTFDYRELMEGGEG